MRLPAPWASVLRRRAALVLALACLLFPVASPAGAAGTAPEYSIKAAYLLLFTRYVTWPADSLASEQAPLVIGILGKDPFGPVLDETFHGEKSNGRRLEIRRLANPDSAAGCHLVFLAGSNWPRLTEWLRALREKPVLTVAETQVALELGAVVNFVMDGNRLRFEVSLPAAETAGLKILTPMLVSARKVHKKDEP